jgi:hypothetical protein
MNVSPSPRSSTSSPDPARAGAASFKRVLGGAARDLPSLTTDCFASVVTDPHGIRNPSSTDSRLCLHPVTAVTPLGEWRL